MRFLKANWALRGDPPPAGAAATASGTDAALSAPPREPAAPPAGGAAGGVGALPTAAERSLARGQRMYDSVLWLHLECGDRTGLLSDVSSLISRHGLFIRAYSGKPLDERLGTCCMSAHARRHCRRMLTRPFTGFELGGESQLVPDMMLRLTSDVPSVLHWSVYCTWGND